MLTITPEDGAIVIESIGHGRIELNTDEVIMLLQVLPTAIGIDGLFKVRDATAEPSCCRFDCRGRKGMGECPTCRESLVPL